MKKDILIQAERIAKRYMSKKPKDINVTDADWKFAKPNVKELLIQAKALEKPLIEAYWQAVESENWKEALFLYQKFVARPYLMGINPDIYTEEKCRKNETDYINEAKEWIADVEKLLA